MVKKRSTVNEVKVIIFPDNSNWFIFSPFSEVNFIHRRYAVLLCCSGMAFLVWGPAQTMGIFTPVFMHYFQLSNAQASLVTSMQWTFIAVTGNCLFSTKNIFHRLCFKVFGLCSLKLKLSVNQPVSCLPVFNGLVQLYKKNHFVEDSKNRRQDFSYN